MNEKGSATILTLLVSAVMITVGIGFNWIVKEHLKAAEGLKAKAEAMVLARSTYDRLIYCILGGQWTQREILLHEGEKLLGIQRLPLGGPGVQFDNGISIKIQDSSSLVSLVSPDVEVLKRLARLLGGDPETLSTLGDSFRDWIDPDDLSHLNGAERIYYELEGKPYGPRNFLIQYKDEFAFIKGLGPELYAKMEPYLTVLPSLGFNPNTADDLVLMAYLDIDREALEKLRNYLAQRPIGSDMEMFSVAGRIVGREPEGVYYFPSPFFEITIKVGAPRAVYTLNLGVDIRQRITSPYSVVHWKEG